VTSGENPAPGALRELLAAIHFAAAKHRDHRRKDPSASPYINHPIEVAEVLARIGGVADLDVLRAAVLHDTLEDTETSPEELRAAFGPRVATLVAEVSDDKSLTKEERKRLQVEHAPHASVGAKLVKLGDKICNVRDVTHEAPEGWSRERRLAYLDWSARVVSGCRGVSPSLERHFDALVLRGRKGIESESV
jgi:guanosine-3',5'-bis(diphosphate) 3'-pyrophosphohydrolase